jgi:integrase
MNRQELLGIRHRRKRFVVDTTYHGQRIWASCATEEMAIIALHKAKTLVDEERYLEVKQRPPKITLSQAREEYLAHCEALGQRSVREKRRHLETIESCLGKNRPLTDVEREDLERFIGWRLDSLDRRYRHQERKVSVPSIRLELMTLQALFSWAVERGWATRNPVARLPRPRQGNRPMEYLDKEESTALVEAAGSEELRRKSPHLEPAVVLGLHTGMRLQELLTLRWPQVNMKQGYIELPNPKSGHREFVLLNTTARETLRRQPRLIDSPYVFPSRPRKGKDDIGSQSLGGLRRSFRSAVKRAKFQKHCTCHTLRHTFISHLVIEGVPLPTVMKLARHRSIQMTLRYAHLAPGHERAAIEQLDAVLGVKEEPSEAEDSGRASGSEETAAQRVALSRVQ